MIGKSVYTISNEGCAVYDGNFSVLKMAKLSCIADSDCISVVDDGCDGEGPFKLCRKEEHGDGFDIASCKNHLKKQGKT